MLADSRTAPAAPDHLQLEEHGNRVANGDCFALYQAVPPRSNSPSESGWGDCRMCSKASTRAAPGPYTGQRTTRGPGRSATAPERPPRRANALAEVRAPQPEHPKGRPRSGSTTTAGASPTPAPPHSRAVHVAFRWSPRGRPRDADSGGLGRWLASSRPSWGLWSRRSDLNRGPADYEKPSMPSSSTYQHVTC
jgi:hypothetical protein